MKTKISILKFTFFIFSFFLSWDARAEHTFKLTDNAINDRGSWISSNGSVIVWPSGSPCGDLYYMRVDEPGSGTLLFDHSINNACRPDISEDGSKIVFDEWVTDAYYISIINSDGSGYNNLSLGGDPSIDDAGENIAFGSVDDLLGTNPEGDNEIYIIKSDGTGLIQLTFNNFEDAYHEISGDGSKVVFACNEGQPPGTYDLCIVNSDGTGWLNLTDGTYSSISYDGNKIAFPDAGVATINSDGTGYNKIYEGMTNNDVCLSGDASCVAFSNSSFNLYRINYYGTGLTLINSQALNPSINNNGHRIVFEGWDGDYELFMWDEIADPIGTPGGSNIFVESIANGMDATYDSVSSGCTTIFTFNPGGRTPPPGKLMGASNLHYFVSSTCSYSGNILIGINYDESDFGDETALCLLHWDGGTWVDITDTLDTALNKITGIASSLSEFIIAESEPLPPSPGSRLINYQGRLADSLGLPVTGSLDMIFSLYEVSAGGTAIWSESRSVDVDGGIYNVLLGGVTPLRPDIFSRPFVYLGVQVGADPEMTPRQQVVSVPGALTIDGNRIEKGAGTLTVSGASSGSASVTFAAPFIAPPYVTIGGLSSDIGGQAFVLTKVENITPTGFTAAFQSLSGATATGSAEFDWMAIGQ